MIDRCYSPLALPHCNLFHLILSRRRYSRRRGPCYRPSSFLNDERKEPDYYLREFFFSWILGINWAYLDTVQFQEIYYNHKWLELGKYTAIHYRIATNSGGQSRGGGGGERINKRKTYKYYTTQHNVEHRILGYATRLYIIKAYKTQIEHNSIDKMYYVQIWGLLLADFWLCIVLYVGLALADIFTAENKNYWSRV